MIGTGQACAGRGRGERGRGDAFLAAGVLAFELDSTPAQPLGLLALPRSAETIAVAGTARDDELPAGRDLEEHSVR